MDSFEKPLFVLGLKGNTPCIVEIQQNEVVGLLPVHISGYAALLFDWYISRIPEEYQNATEQRLLEMVTAAIKTRHEYTNIIKP